MNDMPAASASSGSQASGHSQAVAGRPWVNSSASSRTAEPMRNCTMAVPTTARGSSSMGKTTFLT